LQPAADAVGTGPLSYGQLWAWESMLNDTSLRNWNVTVLCPLPAKVTAASVLHTLSTLMARHEALRTNYRIAEGTNTPVQTISELCEPPLTRMTLKDDPLRSSNLPSDTELGTVISHSFDLSSELAWKAVLLHVADEPRYLVIVCHHITADLFALNLLRSEFLALLGGAEPDGLPRALQPRELAVRQRSGPAVRQRERAAAYWRRFFEDAPASTTEGSSESREGAEILRYRMSVGVNEAQLARAAGRLNVSAFSLIAALHLIGLSRLTDSSRVPLYLAVSNRFDVSVKTLVSNVEQPSVILADVRSASSLIEHARQVHRLCLESYANACYDGTVVAAHRRRVEAERGVRLDREYLLVDWGSVSRGTSLGRSGLAAASGRIVELPAKPKTPSSPRVLTTSALSDSVDLRFYFDSSIARSAMLDMMQLIRGCLMSVVADSPDRVGSLWREWCV
jgi:hypothetical protein